MTSVQGVVQRSNMFTKIVKDENEETGRYRFEVIDPPLGLAFVNAIRRVILSDIPIVGFLSEAIGDEEPSFEVKVNKSPLHNEFMQHRLGLLPVFMTMEENKGFKEDGSLVFELNEKAEADASRMRDITTKDFVCRRNGEMIPIETYFKNPDILITRLRAGEHLHVIGRPIRRTAHLHACFSPVSLCTYSYKQDADAIARSEKQLGPLERERMYIKNEYGEPSHFVFELEPETGIEPIDLVKEAISILRDKVTGMIADLQEENITPKEAGLAGANCYEFAFQNEDDTVGHMVQSYGYTEYVRSYGNGSRPIAGHTLKYIGYCCPHPLDSTMLIRLTIAGKSTPAVAKDVLSAIFSEVIEHLENAMKEILRSR